MREASACDKAVAEITISDTSAQAFRAIIKFMYTGMCDVHHNNALELLHAAHLFCLDGLARGIESFLYQAISVETAIEILIAAHTFTLVDLEEHCVEFIIDHYEIFVSDQGFSKLATHPQILINIMERIKRPKKRRSFRNGSVDEHSMSNSNGRGTRNGLGSGWMAGSNPDQEASKSGSSKSSDMVDGVPAGAFRNSIWPHSDSDSGSDLPSSDNSSRRSSPIN